MKKHIILGILFLASFRMDAQSLRFKHYTTNDFLSQNSVIDIAQDSFGMVWMATQDGLNRYDGNDVTLFEKYFTDITKPTYSRLGQIFVDHQNQVWISTLNGHLEYYSYTTDSFTLVPNIQYASSILEDDEHHLWVATYDSGLYELKPDENGYDVHHYLPQTGINTMVIHENELILGRYDGAYIFDLKEKKTKTILKELNDKPISKIIRAKKGFYWGTHGQGFYFSSDLEQVRQVQSIPHHLNIQDVIEDDKQQIWVATYGDGTYLLGNQGIQQFKHNPQNEYSINYNDIISLFEDREGHIWMGSDGGGVSITSDALNVFHVLSQNQVRDDVFVKVPRSIAMDERGQLWIGTSGHGLTMLAPNGTLETFKTDDSKLNSNRIMSLVAIKNQLWIGHQDGGFQGMDIATQTFFETSDTLPCKTVWNILPIHNNQLLLATRQNGIILYDTKNKTHQIFKPSQLINATISDNIRKIITGNNGIFYMGTEQGEILSLNIHTQQFQIIDIPIQTSIKTLYIENHMLWIGTQGEGIYLYDLEKGEHSRIHKKDGLPNNVIYSILSDTDDFLWISTNKGICQLNKKNILNKTQPYIQQYFTKDSGLINNEFNTGAYFKSRDNIIYFGGLDGINWFNPKDIRKDSIFSHILLQKINYQHHDTFKETSLLNKKKIDLSHFNKNFQIRFNALDFLGIEDKNYQIKLEGIHQNWIENGKSNTANFTNIPPGNYRFRVRTVHSNGEAFQEAKALEINIHPAFWQTNIFRITCICLGMGSILGLLYWRERIRDKKAEVKEKIILSEAKALRNQMNPHFIFNSLNSIDSLILLKKSEKASEYLGKFSQLMRKILGTEENVIDLSEELKNINLYVQLEQLRFSKEFDFNIHVEPDIDIRHIKIPPLVLQPFVENAILHGLMYKEGKGHLHINISRRNSFIIYEIIDDGIGIKMSKKINDKKRKHKQSLGLKITKERIELYSQSYTKKGHVDITEHIPQGTKVTIYLPYQ